MGGRTAWASGRAFKKTHRQTPVPSRPGCELGLIIRTRRGREGAARGFGPGQNADQVPKVTSVRPMGSLIPAALVACRLQWVFSALADHLSVRVRPAHFFWRLPGRSSNAEQRPPDRSCHEAKPCRMQKARWPALSGRDPPSGLSPARPPSTPPRPIPGGHPPPPNHAPAHRFPPRRRTTLARPPRSRSVAIRSTAAVSRCHGRRACRLPARPIPHRPRRSRRAVPALRPRPRLTTSASSPARERHGPPCLCRRLPPVAGFYPGIGRENRYSSGHARRRVRRNCQVACAGNKFGQPSPSTCPRGRRRAMLAMGRAGPAQRRPWSPPKRTSANPGIAPRSRRARHLPAIRKPSRTACFSSGRRAPTRLAMRRPARVRRAGPEAPVF